MQSSSTTTGNIANPSTRTTTTTTTTTRSQFQKKLHYLADRNQELEDNLQISEQTCYDLNQKIRLQELQIKELESSVQSLFQPTNTNLPNYMLLSSDHDEETSTNTVTFVEVLSEKVRQIAELSKMLESLKPNELQTPIMQVRRSTQQSPENEIAAKGIDLDHNDEDVDNDNDNESNTIMKSMIDTLEKERDMYRQKCEALERSINTLKHKNAQREIRSAKSLRFMKQQIDMLETDRKRRHDIQITLEEKISKLEEENELKQEEIAHLQMGLMNQNQTEKRGDYDSQHKISMNHHSIQSSGSSDFLMWDGNSQGTPILASLSRDDDDDTASSTTTISQSDSQVCG